MARKKYNENEINESFFINLGIEKGIGEIIKHHPRFKGRKNEIIEHVDKARLKERVYDIYQNLSKKIISEEKRREYIVKELSDYISTGIALDEEGKEIIMLKGLEERAKSGFIKGYGARKMLKGEQYLDRGLVLAHNLSYIMKSGNYANKMPEIAEAASILENMELLDPLIKAMRYSGALNEKEYNFFQNRVYEKARKSEEGIKKGIEKYIAASVIGILGISLIAFNSGITAAVVGNSKIIGGVAGFILLAISISIFAIFSKKKFKGQNNI